MTNKINADDINVSIYFCFTCKKKLGEELMYNISMTWGGKGTMVSLKSPTGRGYTHAYISFCEFCYRNLAGEQYMFETLGVSPY